MQQAESEQQEFSDEMVINVKRIDALKAQESRIYSVFKVSLDYGHLSKDLPNTQAKDRKQWINLYGTKENRTQAKEYILAICEPEMSHVYEASKELIEDFDVNDRYDYFMKDFKVNCEPSDRMICLNGSTLNVVKALSFIEQLQNDLTNKSSPLNHDIIMYDPYELLDMPQQHTNKPSITQPQQQNTQKVNIENSLKDLKVDEYENRFLMNLGLSLGFKMPEITKALEYFGTSKIGENEFVTYLRTNRQLSEMTLKSMNLTSDHDCEIINYIPSKNQKKRVEISPPIRNQDLVLSKYEELIKSSNQIKNRNEEQLNKEKRLNVLMSGMPNDQQQRAQRQVETLKSTTSNQSSIENESNLVYNPNLYRTDDSQTTKFTNYGSLPASVTCMESGDTLTNDHLSHQQKESRSKSEKRVATNGVQVASVITSDSNTSKLRPIYIDGSNVAIEHGKKRNVFSCKGIKIVVDYFVKRGHDKVEVYIPRHRRGNSNAACPSVDTNILDDLYKNGILKYTPNQCYDDRFVVIAALHHDGIIISNDQYRDLIRENPLEFKNLSVHLLPYVFSDDLFMPAPDPLGRNGPKLDDFLCKSFSTHKTIKTTTSTKLTTVSNGATPSIPPLMQQLLNHSSRSNKVKKNSNQNEKKIKKSNSHVNNQLPIRNVAQTTDLCDTLNAIFPNKEPFIISLLNKYPHEFNVNFFANELSD